MKLLLIHLADAFDAYVLGHRINKICGAIGMSSWWGKGTCSCWYCRRARSKA